MTPVRVVLHATDPLNHAGLWRLLEHRSEVAIVDGAGTDGDGAQVCVVAVERFAADTAVGLRTVASATGVPMVLVAGELAHGDLLAAVACRVVAVVPRRHATAEQLVTAVRAVHAGHGVLSADLVGELIRHVERIQQEAWPAYRMQECGLTPREIDVLRLLADGLDTAAIAAKLCYAERTVKNVMYGVIRRLKLKNRSHAVAYAVRAGII
jgi:DNA-binding NarL/FixJ family response regulator